MLVLSYSFFFIFHLRVLDKSYASVAFICVYQLSGRSNECKKDVDDENDGEAFVEEQEMCDGRIFFVTFFF